MKIKTLSSAIAAGLYSLGAISAVHAAGNEAQTLRTLDLSLPMYREYKAQYQQSQVQENGGANIQLRNADTHSKFVREEGITGSHKYFVRFHEAPAAVYEGGVEGLQGTRDLLMSGANVRGNQALDSYTNHLKGVQSEFVNAAAGKGVSVEVLESFQVALNAVTIELTQDDAERLAQLPSVQGIERVKIYELNTDIGPEFVGAGAAWDGTNAQGIEFKGEGIVAGILDTGINTDHPSFAETGGDGYTVINPLGDGVFMHDCTVTGQESLCNNKLIGVWSHPTITASYTGPEVCGFRGCRPGPQLRPPTGEDYNGHGSHTASTVAGNVLYSAPYSLPESGMEVSDGIDTGFDFDMISGVAPHANIISYQVCYPGNAGDPYAGCPGDALVAGIEQAIMDGVDVINYSISGGMDPWNSSTELAFLAAREAGISVAASAGNSGPALLTANHVSPWLTSVAATTHSRQMSIDVPVSYAGFIDPLLGSEVPKWADTGLVGGSLNSTEITGVVVWAKDYEDINGLKDYNGYCTAEYPAGTFDFYKDGTPITDPVTGGTAANGDVNVFVICQRHVPTDPSANARTAKVANVKAGGADGFIMFNRDRDQGTVPASYELPSVHFTYDQWNGVWPNDGLEDWVDSYSEKGHMITIGQSQVNRTIDESKADQLANFSSQGPSYYAENREVMVPSLGAPGVSIYAAYSDEQPFTAFPSPSDYATLGGTSMAAPHVAGGMALIHQARPDWTPAEVQSALMLTANPEVQDMARNQKALMWATGSGRMDLAKAIDAELIMDVPVEQYMQANPANGGNVGALNTPYMVDTNCRLNCTWVRTFEATVDGSWNVNTTTDETSIKLTANPSSFTLKAGQKQSVVITGEWTESQNMYSAPYGLSVFGEVAIENAANAGVNVARLPVEMVLAEGGLPTSDHIIANRDSDSHVISGLSVREAPQLTARVFDKVAPTLETIKVNQRANGNGSNLWEVTNNMEDPTIAVSWVSVPENAVRFIAEAAKNIRDESRTPGEWGHLGIYVGKDVNGDGIPQFASEAVCKSVLNSIDGKDWCNINQPEAGEYWVVWQNHSTRDGNFVDEFVVATGVVTETTASDMSIEVPATVKLGEEFAATISWTNLDAQTGDFFYTAFDLGSSAENIGNLGMVPLKLTRGDNDVALATSQDRARAGDLIDVTLKVQPNLSGYDRSFEFSTELPEGLDLVAGSLSSNAAYMAGATETGNGFSIAGSQVSSKDWKPDYNITNSVDDAMCRNPNVGVNPDGGYIDLKKAGIFPSSYFNTAYVDGVTPFPFDWVWPGFKDYTFYHNEGSNLASDTLFVHPNAAVDLNGIMGFFGSNASFGGAYPWGSAMQVVGGMWFGFPGQVAGAPYNPSTDDNANSGTSVAFTDKHLIVEWDRYGTLNPVYLGNREYDYQPMDNNHDVQFILTRGYDHSENAYEMYLAYDNLNWGSLGQGDAFYDLATAGVRGVRGPVTPVGGLGADGTPSRAVGNFNLPQILQDNMVWCFDYVGPESSAFNVTFQVRVNASGAGTTQTIDIANAVEGLETLQVTADIVAPSNIVLGYIADQMVNEDETLSGIAVPYMDDDNGVNVITVTGDNISAVVNGNEPGATFDITPAADFDGETVVTVTVADALFPNDKASTSFTLSVMGVNDAPMAMVGGDVTITEGESAALDASGSYDAEGDALSFSWTGPGTINGADTATPTVDGLSNGKHLFTVTVTDAGGMSSEATVSVTVQQASAPEQPKRKSSGGGSVYYLLALLAAAGFIRRRKVA